MSVPLKESALRPPGTDTSLRAYIGRLFEMRRFAWATARYGLSSMNSQTALGRIWLLLEPTLLIAIYWLMFGLLLQRGGDDINFVAYLTVGTVVFDHSRAAVLSGSSAMVANIAILRSFSFPRAVLPLVQVMRATLNAGFASIVMLLVLPLMGVFPAFRWLWLVPLTAVQIVMNYGLALLLARPITRFPDLRQAMPYAFRLLLYTSGVIFPMEPVLETRSWGPLALDLLTINPFYSIVSLARWPALGMRPSSLTFVCLSITCWTLVAIYSGLVVFVRGESEFAGVRTVLLDD